MAAGGGVRSIMSEDGDEPARRRLRSAPAGAPPSGGDILWEIFLRLPALPSTLPRVSLVCNRWRRLAADSGFLLRFRSRHQKAPLLGLFKEYGGWVSFTPVLARPDRVPRQRLSMRIDYGGATDSYPYHGTLLGCRHGRVLVVDHRRREALVCDPVTGDQRRGALPPEFGSGNMAHGAVLCADGDPGHVHVGCHSSPFKVVLVQTFSRGNYDSRARARVYSSETSMWGNLISAPERLEGGYVDFSRPSTLAGNSLYWWIHGSYDMELLEFDIGRQSLAVIQKLPVRDIQKSKSFIHIIRAEDGGVGFAMLSYPSLQMWDLKADGDGAATWFPPNTVNLELVLNMRAAETAIVGYVEDDDAILIKLNNDVFMVQLESVESRKLCESIVRHQYHPFTSLYSSGEFGRCRGLDSMPSPADPAIPTSIAAPPVMKAPEQRAWTFQHVPRKRRS
ncbi:unnamed protein product [Triticum turgidum subsp. durum]|uniref:F-box domain-containing protein n=1 Tax=Triticum turgidum subsp. durum TaxID=4567 RepID=A0A9R1AFB1_TRITD|nr:unnamed protein product [Triticum turgidum subsp. durum]